jgi:hypothetical protein
VNERTLGVGACVPSPLVAAAQASCCCCAGAFFCSTGAERSGAMEVIRRGTSLGGRVAGVGVFALALAFVLVFAIAYVLVLVFAAAFVLVFAVAFAVLPVASLASEAGADVDADADAESGDTATNDEPPVLPGAASEESCRTSGSGDSRRISAPEELVRDTKRGPPPMRRPRGAPLPRDGLDGAAVVLPATSVDELVDAVVEGGGGDGEEARAEAGA